VWIGTACGWIEGAVHTADGGACTDAASPLSSALPGTCSQVLTSIRVDRKERVWVNGKRINAKRSDGALVFRDGKITYLTLFSLSASFSKEL
jgi:hypothetical protein